uniref:Peptidylprolyl isomerase n=1 Tax=Plectus sambesii TaxID=2011161 RepID=A0A914WT74_9BILA
MGTLLKSNVDIINAGQKGFATKDTHSNIFFDLTVNNRPLGRVVFHLDDERLPRTCENFRSLIIGDHLDEH